MKENRGHNKFGNHFSRAQALDRGTMKFFYLSLFVLCFVGVCAGQEFKGRVVNKPPTSNGNNIHVDWSVRYAQKATAAQLAEHALIRDFHSCLQLTFCTVGSKSDPKNPNPTLESSFSNDHSLTMAAGVESAVQTFREVLFAIKDRQPMIRMQQLVASYDLGAATRDPLICQSSFPCQNPATDLRVTPLGKAASPSELSPLIDCNALGSVCPGVSIGCSLCAMFAPGTCSTTCTVGALFCGSTAIGCMEAKRRKNKEKTTTKPAS